MGSAFSSLYLAGAQFLAATALFWARDQLAYNFSTAHHSGIVSGMEVILFFNLVKSFNFLFKIFYLSLLCLGPRSVKSLHHLDWGSCVGYACLLPTGRSVAQSCGWWLWEIIILLIQKKDHLTLVKCQVHARAWSCLLKCDHFCFMSMSESIGPIHTLSWTINRVIPENSSYRPGKTLIYGSSDLICMVFLWIY